MTPPPIEGFVTISSKHSVDDTVVNLVNLLRTKKIKLFAVIDHSGEARLAGLSMPPTRVVLFGNPRAGTPLMLERPSLALDLPLKLLIAEGKDGKTTISWTTPEYLAARHHLAPGEIEPLSAIGALAAQAAA